MLSLASFSGDLRLIQARVPGCNEVLAAYAFVFALNVVAWMWGYRFFSKERVAGYRDLLSASLAIYFLIVIAGIYIDQKYNWINERYLDLRRPEAYRVTHPEAVQVWIKGDGHDKQVGPDLQNLLQDSHFQDALRNRAFYKQDFDEAFQLWPRSVMFGYKADSPGSPKFLIVRFPKGLAEALGFRPVADLGQH